MGKNFPDGVADDKVGNQVPGNGRLVDEDQLVAPVVVDQARGGIDVQ